MVDIMQWLSVFVNIYISFTERKTRIYVATFILNISQLLMYFYNDDLTAALIYIVIVTRSFLYIYKEKFKTNLIPFTAIVLQIILGMVTLEKPLQIMAIVIPCYSTFYLWFSKDTQKLRIGNIVANFAWGIYNLCCGLYIVLIMRLITVLSNVIAYIKRYNEIKKGIPEIKQ